MRLTTLFFLGAVVSSLGSNPGAETENSIAELIYGLEICPVAPGGGPPVEVSLGILLGSFNITRLCCRKTILHGLDASLEPTIDGTPWQGSASLKVTIDRASLKCDADWLYGGYTGTFDLEAENSDAIEESFLKVGVDLAGKGLAIGPDTYPFFGSAAKADCKAHFVLTKLQFYGPAQTIVNLLMNMVTPTFLQSWLVPVICHTTFSVNFPPIITDMITKAREQLQDLLKYDNIADLDPPAAPSGGGKIYNLTESGGLAFAHHLLQQGLQSGDLGSLIQRITTARGDLSVAVPGGTPVNHVSLRHPFGLDMDVYLERLGIQGVHTIEAVDMQAVSARDLEISMKQETFQATISLMTESTPVALPTVPPRLKVREASSNVQIMRRLAQVLVEKFTLFIDLSNLKLSGRLGVLADEQQVTELFETQSWYAMDCLPSLIQNISVRGIDVDITIDGFKWVSPGHAPDEIEADFDKSVTNIMSFVSDPRMRPLVTRLLKATAAHKVREVANEQLQSQLANYSATMCNPKLGLGDDHLYQSFSLGATIAAGLAAFAFTVQGCAWILRKTRLQDRQCCSVTLRMIMHGNWGAAFLVLLSGCMLFAGFLGHPFRAAVRLHDGTKPAGQQDTLLYLFVLGAEDGGRTPAGVLCVLLSSVVLVSARQIAVTMAALGLFPQKSGAAVRYLTAIAGWDTAAVLIIVGTQIMSFYVKFISFGDSYADMGAQLNPSFYMQAAGLLCLDAASLAVYRACCVQSARKIADSGIQPVDLQEARPRVWAFLLLLATMAGFVLLPWLPLYTHRYSGIVGNAMHYQSEIKYRTISLDYMIGNAPALMLNTLWHDVGVFMIRGLLIVPLIAAPLAHAFLACVVGVMVRRRMAAFTAPRDTLSVVRLTTATKSCGLPVTLLVWARMWAAADAFAMFMLVYVPELADQMLMMAEQTCDPLEPVLKRFEEAGLGSGCMTMSSKYDYGLFIMLLLGVLTRVGAEFAAHRPLRTMIAQQQACCMMDTDPLDAEEFGASSWRHVEPQARSTGTFGRFSFRRPT